jgi:hypothetical protein
MQGETIVDLIPVVQVFADRVDHEPDQVRVFVQQEGDCEVSL